MGCVNTKDVQKVEQIKVEELTKDELESLSRNSGVNVKMLKLYADFLYKNRIHLIGCINQYSTYGSVFTIYDETIQQLAILKIYEDSTLSSVYKNSYQYIQQRNILKIYNFIQSQRLKATFLVVELCSGIYYQYNKIVLLLCMFPNCRSIKIQSHKNNFNIEKKFTRKMSDFIQKPICFIIYLLSNE